MADDGLPPDSREPNGTCASSFPLGQVGSDGSGGLVDATLYPGGDADIHRIQAHETDSTCGCGLFSSDEDYEFRATLIVPAGAGGYLLCLQAGVCTENPPRCTLVNAGAPPVTLVLPLDGTCLGTDVYETFISVRGSTAPAFSCAPCSLSWRFEAGLCQ